jgi:hypothetical protein
MIDMNVTNCTRNDGFGAQYQSIIFAILHAEMYGYNFYYTPFSSIAHNYDKDSDFLIKKENFINLTSEFPTVSQLSSDTVVRQLCGREDCWNRVESNLTQCLNSYAFQKIKKAFHSGKTPIHNKDFLNIALHIRKPNIEDNRPCSNDDNYFLKMIDYIRKNYSGNKIFHIYSQGEKKNFSIFENEDVIFHLNECMESTFYSMVTADILVMSKSSFSYAAAMLNENIVYYLPFWHKRSLDWKIK